MVDETPKISVIIPTKNRFHDIIECIKSILVQTLLPDEIIIVDASDTQELNSKIEEFKSEKTKSLYIHTKPGLTYQRNVGIGASCGDIVFFLDDDVILDNDFVKEIVNVFENDKERKIGGVCGDIINIKNQNRSVIHSLKGTISSILATIFFRYKIGNGKFRLSGFPTYPYGVNKILNVECLPGGLTAYRRAVLNEFKFDENLHGYCFMEDDDFSYRVSRKYKNVYAPYAKVIHNVSLIARNHQYAKMKMLIENHYYLFKKNIPQTFKHKFAFYMSICGLFVMIMIARDKNALKGLIDGMINISKK
jgi:GT2 family glycosyltransferase